MNTKLIGIIILVSPFIFLPLHYVSEWLAIDSCLDSGKVYNYQAGECSEATHLEPISYGYRYWWLLLLCGFVGLLGIKLLTSRTSAPS